MQLCKYFSFVLLKSCYEIIKLPISLFLSLSPSESQSIDAPLCTCSVFPHSFSGWRYLHSDRLRTAHWLRRRGSDCPLGPDEPRLGHAFQGSAPLLPALTLHLFWDEMLRGRPGSPPLCISSGAVRFTSTFPFLVVRKIRASCLSSRWLTHRHV